MDIFIPSSGRPSRQTTWENLPALIRGRAIIVVPHEEVQSYKMNYPIARVMGIGFKGIGKTRQWCIDRSLHKVVMLDDDLVFARRRTDNKTLFNPASVSDIEEMFAMIERLLDRYTHVGVGTREGGNRLISDLVVCNRMLRVLAYNAHRFTIEKIRFDRLPVMEDFDVTLQLLRKGHANAIINWIVHNQNGSNLPGGCSQYRTPLMQAEAALALRDAWPDYVKVRDKATKTAWGGGTRKDVVIQWKKAYNDALVESARNRPDFDSQLLG